MTRWPAVPSRRIERLRQLSEANMRQSLSRVRLFCMRAGLRRWDPYPIQRKTK